MNKAERERFQRLSEMDCIACGRWGVEIHHLTDCGRRKGHMFTIPLCPEHHRLGKVSVHLGKKTFERTFGTQQELLEKTNLLLDMPI